MANNTPQPRNAAGLSDLCTTCQTTGPWSPAGWKDFHTQETYRTHLSWMNEDPSLHNSVAYEVDVAQFYADAETCAWCSLLREELRVPPTLETAIEHCQFTGFSIKLEFCAPEGVKPVRINVVRVSVIAQQEGGFVPFRTTLRVLARPGSLGSNVFFAPHSTDYQDSQFDHELAGQWIEQCAAQHRNCKSAIVSDSSEEGGSSLPLLPTRILVVTSQPDKPHEPSIVLREATPGETGRYICMSYTWGPHRRHNFPQLARSLLLQGNVGEDKDSPIAELPAVFTDAAHVALRLGIRHLWIDALCIWQDDPADVKAELSQMHRYYTDATVVVQTSGTASVDDKFLGEARNVDDVGTLLARAASEGNGDGDGDGDGDRAGVFLRLPYRHEHYRDPTLENQRQGQKSDSKALQTNECYDDDDGQSLDTTPGQHEEPHPSQHTEHDDDILYICPLSSLPAQYNPDTEPSAARGWIFQEQILCRRLLTFPSGGGMLFRCDSGPTGGLSDGQVDFRIPEVFGRPGQRSGGKGLWWAKQTLMQTTDFPDGITYIPMNDRLLVQVEFMRRLAVLGNRPELVMEPGGSVALTIDLKPEDREKRSRGWAENRADRLERMRWLRARQSEDRSRKQRVLEDVSSVTEQAEAADGDADAFSRLHLDNDAEVDGECAADEEQAQSHRAPTANTDHQHEQEQEEGDDSEEDDRLTRFEPFDLEMRVQFTDGTSHPISLGPSEHPFLRMCRGERTLMIATGPWPGSVFPAGVLEAWKALVSEYCSRVLTDPRDKLVAMSALASAFGEHYGSQVLGGYDAGIWTEFAGEGLLWFSAWRRKQPVLSKTGDAVGEDPGKVVVEYDDRAPSWSWAAVPQARYPDPKTEIENGVDYMALDFKVLAIQTTPAENSPAKGAVTNGGKVRVAGLVMDAWWAMDKNQRGEEVVNLFTEEHGEERVGKYGNASPDHWWLFPPDDGQREHVLLFLGRRFVQGVGHNDDHEGECLLLRPRRVEDSREGNVADDEYVRVGFAGPVFMKFEEEWRPRFRQVEITIY
ncbi:HET domain-containing protein [Microdochium nivale]|nr:HET domain-containing protein [Microdochium nivale]